MALSPFSESLRTKVVSTLTCPIGIQMSVCAKQTVELHRESVDNLHQVVDANVKVSYTH